jgi:hypothetical protein
MLEMNVNAAVFVPGQPPPPPPQPQQPPPPPQPPPPQPPQPQPQPTSQLAAALAASEAGRSRLLALQRPEPEPEPEPEPAPEPEPEPEPQPDAWDDADDIAAARVLPLDGDERSPRQRQPSNILADFRVLHVVGRGGFGKVPRTCAPSPRIVVPVRPGQGNAERVERALCR